MGATGESVRRVTDYGYDPAWSPDGQELVVATEPLRDPMSRMGGSQLWAVRATGEGKRLISEGDGMGPKWSPDGRFIAYWGVRPETWQRDLWTVAADGSGAKAGAIALTDDASIDWGVEWSPDGRFLYFSSNRGGTMNLLRIPIDPRSGAALGAPEPVTTPAAWAGSLSFAKDGRQFAFGTRDWRADAWKVAFDPDREALLGRPLPILRGQPLQELDWSPDGTSLAFARRGLPWESLGVVRADGSGYSQLTDASFQHRALRWSPDGQRIAFQSQRGGVPQVWVMRHGRQRPPAGVGDRAHGHRGVVARRPPDRRRRQRRSGPPRSVPGLAGRADRTPRDRRVSGRYHRLVLVARRSVAPLHAPADPGRSLPLLVRGAEPSQAGRIRRSGRLAPGQPADPLQQARGAHPSRHRHGPTQGDPAAGNAPRRRRLYDLQHHPRRPLHRLPRSAPRGRHLAGGLRRRRAKANPDADRRRRQARAVRGGCAHRRRPTGFAAEPERLARSSARRSCWPFVSRPAGRKDMRLLVGAAVASVLISGAPARAQSATPAPARDALVGTWRLVSFEDVENGTKVHRYGRSRSGSSSTPRTAMSPFRSRTQRSRPVPSRHRGIRRSFPTALRSRPAPSWRATPPTGGPTPWTRTPAWSFTT